MSQAALPNSQPLATRPASREVASSRSRTRVRIQLRIPVCTIRLRQSRDRTIRVRMPMPEATVHEDYRTMPRENQVGPTRHSPSMQPKTIFQGDEPLSGPSFRASYLASGCATYIEIDLRDLSCLPLPVTSLQFEGQRLPLRPAATDQGRPWTVRPTVLLHLSDSREIIQFRKASRLNNAPPSSQCSRII